MGRLFLKTLYPASIQIDSMGGQYTMLTMKKYDNEEDPKKEWGNEFFCWPGLMSNKVEVNESRAN
jgi:hypothetical protein